MQTTAIGLQNLLHGFDIEVLVKNERVLVCKVRGNGIGPCYLQYHAATGWQDLENGETALSRQMASVARNPFRFF